MTNDTPPHLEAIADQAWQEAVELLYRDLRVDAMPALHELIKRHITRAHQRGMIEKALEHDMVADMIQRVADERYKHATDTVVATIMDQLSMDQLTLQLDQVATVWSRHELRIALSDDSSTITYTLERKPE